MRTRELKANRNLITMHMLVSLIAMLLVNTSSLVAQDSVIETLCVVRELEDVEVPAKREGLIERLLVRRGNRVNSEELLASLETKDTRLRLDVTLAELRHAETKANNEGRVLSSQANVDRARQEKLLMKELGDDAVYLERFRTDNSLRKATADLSTAKSERQQDVLMADVKRSEVALLENDIEQTSIFSPVEGVVRELIKNQGEWVRKGEPILVVTRMDRLLVEGFLDSDDVATSVIVGAEVSVAFKINGKATTVFDDLRVAHAAPKLELDGKFPVWVELPNRLVTNASGAKSWLIRPGMKAKMKVQVGR